MSNVCDMAGCIALAKWSGRCEAHYNATYGNAAHSGDQDVAPGEPWHIDWDSCCTRCHALMNWEGDPPEGEDDALCSDCVWREVEERRAEVEKLTKERDGWRHVAAYFMGDRVDSMTAKDARATAVREAFDRGAEVEKLRATLEDRDADKRLSVSLAQENERLRAAIRDLLVRAGPHCKCAECGKRTDERVVVFRHRNSGCVENYTSSAIDESIEAMTALVVSGEAADVNSTEQRHRKEGQ